MENEMLIAFGDAEIKQLPGGKIGGMLVRFSTDKDPDLAGEFFTKATDFSIENGAKTPVYLNHRLPLDTPKGGFVVVKEKIGEGKLFKNDDGILIEAILYNRKKYEKALQAMGWSSGTASHLVDKERVGKAFQIKTWPLGLDASITPEPCEPRNGVYNCKSVKFVPIEDPDEPDEADVENKLPAKSLAARLSQHIDDSVDDGHQRPALIKRLADEAIINPAEVGQILSGEVMPTNATLKAFSRVLNLPYEQLKQLAQQSAPQTIKGTFDALGDSASIAEIRGAFASIAGRIARTRVDGVGQLDPSQLLDEAIAEYIPRLKTAVLAQVMSHTADDQFYLKDAIDISPEAFRSVTEHLPMDEHVRLVGTAEDDLVARFAANADKPHGKSYKAGRELSKRNRQRLMDVQKMHDDHHGAVAEKIQAILDDTQPKADPSEKRAAFLKHQRVKLALQRQQTGV